MAVNDFWRRLARDLTIAEIDAGLYISPILFQAALYDAATGVPGGITIPQARISFNLAIGTNAGDEFTDLVQSVATIINAGDLPTQRSRRLRVLDGITFSAILAGRLTKLPSNPYPTGLSLRLHVKELVILEGGTPQGTLV